MILRGPQRLSGPDAIAGGPDDDMDFAVNKLHLSAKLNAGENASQPSHYIVRFQALATTVVGR